METPISQSDLLSTGVEQLEQLQLAQDQLAVYASDLSSTYRALRASQARLEASYLSTLSVLAAAIEARDSYLVGHSRRVSAFSRSIGSRMGLTPQQMESLRRAALLHDIGKIGIQDQALKMPGSLDPESWQEVRHHPELSSQILSGLDFLEEALPGILYHHERYDGLGYPEGLAGEDIPIFARILAVCDSYDAMTSDRPYRPAMPREKALDEIRSGSGSQFDPRIVQVFVEWIAANG